MKYLLITLSAAVAMQSAFAGQLIKKTGIARGKACSVTLRIEDNGFVSGVAVSGKGIQTVSGRSVVRTVESNLMDYQTFARMGFVQTPFLGSQGTSLYSYYDTSLFAAEQTKVDVYDNLVNPTAVNLWYAHLEGPVVKFPVNGAQVTCANLK